MKKTICRIISGLLVAVIALAAMAVPAMAANVDDFVDVPSNAWYFDTVEFAAAHDLVNGTSETTFSPNSNISRAQFVTILYRAFGANEVINPSWEFSDVPASSYYRDAVYWGLNYGIVYGTGNYTFSPKKDITRQEAVVMLGRTITQLSINIVDADNPTLEFSDADIIADWAMDSVDLMRQKALITGYTDGTFRPKKNMTRAEGTTVLVRFVQAATEPPERPKDIDQIHFISLHGAASDSTLVESQGKYMLVDAGNPDASVGGNYAVEDNRYNGDAVVSYLRSIGVTHLDYLVMTHNHSDHIGGVPLLCKNGFVDSNTTVYYRTNKRTDEDTQTDYQNVEYLTAALDSLESVNANIISLLDTNTTELSFDMGNFHIDFRNLDEDHDGKVDFCTEDENRNSIVLKITKGDFSALLAADLDLAGEKKLLENGDLSDIDILKLSHHGYNTSNSFYWLDTIHPSATVLTRDQWYTGENDGMVSYACLKDKRIPVYACDSQKKAIIVDIQDDNYTIYDINNLFSKVAAAELTQPIADGFYYWSEKFIGEKNAVKIEDGKMVKDDSRTNDAGETYHFDHNGIGTMQ